MADAVKTRRRRFRLKKGVPAAGTMQSPDAVTDEAGHHDVLEAAGAVPSEVPAGVGDHSANGAADVDISQADAGAAAMDGVQARDGPALEDLSVLEPSQVEGETQGFLRLRDSPDDTGEEQALGKGCGAAAKLHAKYQDHVWNMALVSTCMANGQPIELLTVMDGYTQECLSIVVERRVSLEAIVDRLFDLFVLREVPKYITLTGSSKSVSRGLAEWLKRLPVETEVSESESCSEEDGPGSFSIRLREEVLAEPTFAASDELGVFLEKWRRYYNETRPQHSPLEDEPQAPEGNDAAMSLETDPAVGQALEPEAGSADSAQPDVKASGKWEHKDGWDVKWPKWAVYLAKAGECVGILLVFVLLVAVVLVLLAPHFGWRADTVLSGSMEPALPVGAVEVTRPVNIDDIQVGDIITFRSPTNGALMSHRVVEVVDGETYGFRTKGDNNEDVDPYVIPAENVVGRFAFKVDDAGRVVEYLKTPLGFILLGLCGFALIAAEISTMLEVRWKEAARADTKAK